MDSPSIGYKVVVDGKSPNAIEFSREFPSTQYSSKWDQVQVAGNAEYQTPPCFLEPAGENYTLFY
jgi:hypothetical protein